ncbi:MAG TPA: ABC transporter permease [Terracidiphilus sp.]|nr:ABC transporter permease [Terracidiphilus sp.]
MEALLNDLRFALRQLRKMPGMSLLAVVTLALGVGANAAIFTVIESVLLRPLPYADSASLISIGPHSDKPAFSTTSWLNFRDIQDHSRLLVDSAGYSDDISVLEAPEGSQSIVAPRVSTNVFSMLGARPLLGRTFNAAEGLTGGPDVAILSEGLWRKAFHANPAIVGQSVKIGGKSRTIVGVMPRTFHFPEQIGTGIDQAVWLPLQPTHEMLSDRGYHFFLVVAKLRPNVTIQQAQHELDAIAAHIPRKSDESKITFQASSYQELLTGPVRPTLYALFAALALVLLIACANVSNMLIARCLTRQQEFAVRAAVGAGRGRLVRQLLSEGMTLSLLGCCVGVAFAELAILAIRKLPDGTIPRADAISIHWTILLVLAAISIVTTVLSSLLPTLIVARANPQAALLAASRSTGTRNVSGKLSGSLVAGEVALSTLLLVGTGLLFHTLWNLNQARLGFEVAHVTTFSAMPADSAGFSSMAVSEDTTNAPTSVAALTYEPMLDVMRRLPGVESAAMVTSPPLSGIGISSSFDIVGRPKVQGNSPSANVSAVSGDYARTMGTPIVRGRMIENSDAAGQPFITVVNQTLAKKYFRGQDPVGKQIDLGGKDTGMVQPLTIVGVLGDQVDSKPGAEPQPLILLPEKQIPTTSLFYQALLKTVVNFVVKTRGTIPVETVMRAAFRKDAPGLALDDFQSMQDVVDKNTFSQRLLLYLVGSFAGLAIAMVIAGLHGVLSQLVSYRRREIGVRMALGATRLSVAQMILRQGSILIGAGLVLGILLAVATGRLIKGFLYQVQPLDAWTYAAVAVALAGIGLISAFIPAHRAASIQPVEALREE